MQGNDVEELLKTIIALSVVTLILALTLIALRWWQRRLRLLGYASLLQGAAWDIVRFMENNPRTTAKKNRVGQEQIFQANVVAPAERLKLAAAPEMSLSQELFPRFITEAGERLTNYNREEVDKFWFKVQGMRNGIQCFLAIMMVGNPGMARLRMIEHMKRQRDEWDKKGKQASPNFTELKMLLNLPTEWPAGELPELLLLGHLDGQRALDIAAAARRYRNMILAHLEYKVWPEVEGEERATFTGVALLEAMRDYTR